MTLKQNQGIYKMRFLGMDLIDLGYQEFFGLRQAAKELGVLANTVVSRVKHGTIHHVRINNRPFIPDYVIEIEKTRSNQIECFHCEFENFPWKISVWRLNNLKEIINFFGKATVTLKPIEISRWEKSKIVTEFFDIPPYFIKALYSNSFKIRYIMILKTENEEVLNTEHMEIPEEKFSSIKGDLFKDPESTINQNFPNLVFKKRKYIIPETKEKFIIVQPN